jgi:hypothetical protein
MGADERFWVRASQDAPDKGPYTRAQIEQSNARGLLKETALVRPEAAPDTESKSLRDFCEEKAIRKEQMLADWKRADEERGIKRGQNSGSGRLWLGVVMLALGDILTVDGYAEASNGWTSSGVGTYVVFTGLIVMGIVNIVRGLSAS